MTSALPPNPPPPAAYPAAGWAPPPPPPPAPPRPQLRRSRTDKVLGGVAGGLADYTGIDALLWLLMPPAPAPLPGEVPDAQASRPRSPVPGVTAAALLIVLGVGVLLTQYTDLDLGARGVLGSAVLVIGVGLVVGAVTGVGRAAKGVLIGLGVLLTAALAVVSTVDVPDGEVGDRTYRPATAAAVQRDYDHTAGDFILDLSEVDVADLDGPVVTKIDHGLGDIEVVVPRSADVEITVEVGVGEIDLFGDRSDGGSFPGTGTADWTGDDEPEFRITIESGLGDVEVSRG